MLNNSILSGAMATGKRRDPGQSSANPSVSSTTGSKKKLSKSSSMSSCSDSSSKRSKNKDTAAQNQKEKKKRHSFSFGFFSDRSSSKQTDNNTANESGFERNQSSDNKTTTTAQPQHERKKNHHHQQHSSGSSPKNIQRGNSIGSSNNNNNNRTSPKLTNKTYRSTNSSFEKAALFGQREESLSFSDDEDINFPHQHQQYALPPPLAYYQHPLNLPIPAILINGETWDGKTEISDDEDERDGATSTLDHNLFITSNGLIQRGGSMECMAGGKGLRQGFVDTESTFFIETEEPFDTCSLRVEIKGPKQKPIKITTHLLDENLCSFSYWARRVGYYLIGVKWKGEHVVGSPFDVTILAINKSTATKKQ